MNTLRLRELALLAALVFVAQSALAANGLSDDRVSLPDGPGSIGGVGEDVAINPNMGSSSYKVAIEVPRGATEEMTPALALNYSSGQGLGIAGIGWELAWPVIERTTAKGLPEYDTEDLFSADGSELVYVGDAAGAREYRARFEGAFARYRWHDAGAGEAGYWTAEYPDGRTAWFGATADGTLVPSARVSGAGGETFAYHLVELQDSVGRRVVQTYTKSNGWPLLDEVQYGFGGQATPRFSVRAGYEARSDVVSDATPGHVIELTQRLSGLAVYSGALLIKRYELVYEADADAGGMSRLERVSVYGRDGGKHPIEHSFRYSRSLGGACDVGCEQPFLVDMGTLPGGVNIGTGRAALLDINGDSLPDVVSSDETGLHTFYVSALDASGHPRFSDTGTESTMGGGALRFLLGSPRVQLFDVNGDGFVDIVDQLNATALCNYGEGDWSSEGCVTSPDQLPTLEDDPADAASEDDPLGMRFFDYDNDKRMDLLRTSAVDSATVYVNSAGGFTAVPVTAIGAVFDIDRLELSDMNGDGLLDPVQLVEAGSDAQVRYRLNLGFGNWADPVSVTVADLSPVEFDDAVLEDIDGDGLSDIVVVAGSTISYWRNLNGDRFSGRVDIESGDVAGGIPVRDGNETVLFADMNGNGTDDVVYISSAGAVRFVELFPVRPNLLSRIENGVGWVRTLRYGTAVAERARDEATADAWHYRNPIAMVVVKETDSFVTLSGSDGGIGLHEVARYDYRDAYYDPSEKAFRGFERVHRYRMADTALDSQEPALEVMLYDLGRDDVYRAGRLLETKTFGGDSLDVPMREVRTEYDDCALGGALATLDPPVRFVCATATVTIHQEGRPEPEWVTTRKESSYDIYGNVIDERLLGVVHYGPPEDPLPCAACDGPAGLDSGACGAMCEGDESFVEMEFVEPGADTGGRWLLRLATRSASSNGLGEPAETLYFYDGPDFVGLPAGEATRGLPTRVMHRVAGSDFVPSARSAWDAAGNLVATLEPNGDPDDPTAYRRDYEHDDRGLRVTKVTVRAGDYDLVQEVSYESVFLKPSEATRFFVVDDGEELTNRNGTRYRYDEHGRPRAIIKPGDSDAAPSEEYSYELADPVSRIVVKKRRTPGGPADVVQIRCIDGRGQQVSTRIGVGDGAYLVEGLRERNARNAVVREYLPFTSDSEACETEPPEGVGATTYRYDALARELEVTVPDEGIYGTASVRRTVYLPLATERYDEMDTADGAHADTPTRTVLDGLERVIRLERILDDDTLAAYRLSYDARGHLARVDGPDGSLAEQEHDYLGRVVSVSEDNRGVASFAYDAQGLLVSHTDARGVTVVNEYDAVGRPVATYDEADPEGTREATRYDYDPDCSDCRDAAGDVVGTSYAGGSDAYGYDPRGRRVMLRRTLDGATFTTRYAYDGADSLVSITYPDGQVIETEFDDAGRPIRVPGFVTALGYSAEGRLATIAHDNGVVETRSYDVLQRAIGLRIDGFYDVTLTRDRAGNVTSAASDGSGLDRAASYQVDGFYRTTAATLSGAEELTMAFGLDDNILSMTSSIEDSPANVGAYSYDDAKKNAVTAAGTLAYSYDESGNVTSRGDVTFTWDHLSRLVAAASAGEEEARFFYDRERTRVIKEEHGGVTYYPAPDFVVRDGISTTYVRAGDVLVARNKSDELAPMLLPDGDGNGVIDIADAALGSDGPAATRLLRAAARRVLFASAAPYAALHEDLTENVIAATSAEGELLAERDVYPYGETRTATGFVDERSFSGQERDESTGLFAFDQRYLDPRAGRWLSPDPAFGVLDAGGVGSYGQATTAYAYVGNQTFNAVDPTGLLGKKLVKKAGQKLKQAFSKKARLKAKRGKLLSQVRELQQQRQDLQTEKRRLDKSISRTLAAPRLLQDFEYSASLMKTKHVEVQRFAGRGKVETTTEAVDDYSQLNDLFMRERFQRDYLSSDIGARERVTAEIGALDHKIQSLQARYQATYEQKRAQLSRPERTAIVNKDLMGTFGISLDPN